MDNFKDFFGRRKLQLEAKLDKTKTKEQARQEWINKGFSPEEADIKVRFGSFVPEEQDVPNLSNSTPIPTSTSTGSLELRTSNKDQLAKNMARASEVRAREASPEGLHQAAKDRERSQMVDKGLDVITDPAHIEQLEKDGLVYLANNAGEALVNATKLRFPYYGYISARNRRREVRPVPSTVTK